MIKFLLVIFVFFFVLMKLGGLLLRVLYCETPHRTQYHRTTNRKPGNVNIDYVPEKKEKFPENFRGGDYVDFEEVKESG